MKNKLLNFIMMFLLFGPSIAFSMETNNMDNDFDDYLVEKMDIEYPTEENDEFETEEDDEFEIEEEETEDMD